MKKIFFCFLFLFLFISVYSQTYTEKYNSLNNRYEFFNSSGSMIGYKFYNSLNQRWETYMTNTSDNSTPIQNQFNPNLAIKALSIRQGKYDTNLARVNEFIESLKTRLYNSTFDATTVQNIRFRFNSEFTSQVSKYDLSSSATTQKVIQWLDEGYNHIINIELRRSSSEENVRQEEIIKKEEFRKESLKVEVNSFKNKYGGYYVSSIEEYDLKDKKWVKLKSSKNIGQVYYKGTIIYFRKSYTSNWIFRQLIYQDYSKAYKAHNYTSSYGETKINDAFTVITFYDSDKMFVYTLGKFDKNIKL
jgi:hypothetical protein